MVRAAWFARRCWCRAHRLLWLLIALAWFVWLLRSLAKLCRIIARDRARQTDGTVPSWAYRQPDPMIYSQQYLQAQGLAVTWDNPDIHLELPAAPGVPVDSHSLHANTDYVVVARIWNGSTVAPAVGLPVKVSYLEFGIGTTRHDVGLTAVDLAVKGAPGCPAFGRVPWHTPAQPGHYCLQVDLLWDDDANPANDMGQLNTDVKQLNPPHATFAFPIRNDGSTARLMRLETDSYEIPPLLDCPPDDDGNDRIERQRSVVTRHDPSAWPIPNGWQVVVQPDESRLAAGESTQIAVDITAPAGYRGRQVVNVNALDGGDLVGGVTLYVEGN